MPTTRASTMKFTRDETRAIKDAVDNALGTKCCSYCRKHKPAAETQPTRQGRRICNKCKALRRKPRT